MRITQLFDSLTERLRQSAQVGNVFGEPIEVGEKTILPVARIGYGFGGGGGSAETPREASAPSTNGATSTEDGEEAQGGGGGGGVGASPLGVFEITPDSTRFVPVGARKKLLAALAVGFVLGCWFRRK
jgi:uncharacterized spore protein YtfJ